MSGSTTLVYSEKGLLERLSTLSVRGIAAFSAACAGRLFPAYQKVAIQLPGDGPNCSHALLTEVWNWSLGASIAISNADIEHVIALIAPDDDGETHAHAIADDALASIAYAARYTLTSDPREAAWAARRVYEATDHFGAGRMSGTAYTPEMEVAILASDIVQQELRRQQRDLSDLTRANIGPDRRVLMLKERSEAESALPLMDLGM